MNQLVYLLVAVVLSAVGSGVLWYRHHKPKSVESGIAEFNKELRALSPEHRGTPEPRRRDPG